MKPQCNQAPRNGLTRSNGAGRFLLLFCTLVFAFSAKAQTFNASTSAQTMYPTTGTGALNLDKAKTRYLSNFSFPGSGALTGETIQIAGWSTNTDGGFSYGRASATPPYTYVGDGAVAIPDARDVQVGFTVSGANEYIIAAYYDNNIQLYAYDLYSYAFTPPSTVTVTKLYTYHFEDPDHPLPGYIICTDYFPAYPLTSTTAPVLTSTMGYNRISMDVDKDGQRIAMVMTNNDNGRLYLAAGQMGTDTVTFSPNMPVPGDYAAVTMGALTEMPDPHFPYPGSVSWTLHSSGLYYDYYDATSGYYVRYYIASGEYHYSYYPLDLGMYVTVYDGTTVTSRTTVTPYLYNPLIGIKGCSYTTGPGTDNAYFNYLWPDVCFSGDYIRIVFYVNNPEAGSDYLGNEFGAEDLYLTPPINTFSDYYTFTGEPTYMMSGGKYAGPTHMEVACLNTFDGRPLRATPTTFLTGTYGFESQCKSLVLAGPGDEIRAHIDAPDESSYNSAVTFAYSNVPISGYSVQYYEDDGMGSPVALGSPENIHNLSEYGKKNIYVRHEAYGSQAILTNGSAAGVGDPVAIHTNNNTAPVVAFQTGNPNEIAVAWASEDAGVGTPWSYIAMQVNIAGTYGTTGMGGSDYVRNTLDYLRLPNTPNLPDDCGSFPLVSLSRHDYGESSLYTCFTQEDMTPVYSLQHQNHDWTSSSTWRLTDQQEDIKLSAGPNPFTNTLHVHSSEGVSVKLSDMSGKQLFRFAGSTESVNRQLDNSVKALAPGIYLLDASTLSGKKEVFKVTKQ